MLEKDANVTYPKTKCDLCHKTASVVVGKTALCADCNADQLRKQAELKVHDVYFIPHNAD